MAAKSTFFETLQRLVSKTSGNLQGNWSGLWRFLREKKRWQNADESIDKDVQKVALLEPCVGYSSCHR